MKRQYIVTRTAHITYTHKVEAENRQEAVAIAEDLGEPRADDRVRGTDWKARLAPRKTEASEHGASEENRTRGELSGGQLTTTGLNCHFCGLPAIYYGETTTLGRRKVGMCEYHRSIYGCGDIKPVTVKTSQ